MPKGLRLGRGRKVCQNDQYIKLINFCFGSELVKVIPTEEAYSMPMGLRSVEVKKYVKMTITSS